MEIDWFLVILSSLDCSPNRSTIIRFGHHSRRTPKENSTPSSTIGCDDLSLRATNIQNIQSEKHE
jgi:hypothetical protein